MVTRIIKTQIYPLVIRPTELSLTLNRQLISIFINISFFQIGLNGFLPGNYFISRLSRLIAKQPLRPIRHDQCRWKEDHLTRWGMAGNYRSGRCGWLEENMGRK